MQTQMLVIVGTSGSGPFDAGVGASHPASGGHFWPPKQNRRWPEVGSRNLTFSKEAQKNSLQFKTLPDSVALFVYKLWSKTYLFLIFHESKKFLKEKKTAQLPEAIS